MADGDLRSQLHAFSNKLDTVWKLRSLHNIAVGLKQLHGAKISHQDLKPSNVLIYEQGRISKVGDLGRALCQDIIAPHDNDGAFAGDHTYAPPEVFYGYKEPDWLRRAQQIDLYMFGSLVSFYFTGATVTGLIFNQLDPQFHYYNWHGSYKEVKSYIIDAFGRAINILKQDMDDPYVKDLISVIEDCSNADPELRGLKAKRNVPLAQPFENVVSKLDRLALRAEYKLA